MPITFYAFTFYVMRMVSAMEIRLNGKVSEVAEGATVRRLLDELGLHPLRVAVQRNQDIVKRERYEEVVLQPGDTVEILTIMAGG
jgi:thiamine biosynthesis protein ThiS